MARTAAVGAPLRHPAFQRLWPDIYGPADMYDSVNEICGTTAICWLFPFLLTLHNCDVTIDRQIGKTFHCTAEQWPFHLHPVDPCSFANAEHEPRIV